MHGLWTKSILMVGLLLSCQAKQTTECEDPKSSDCPTSPLSAGGAVQGDVKITSIKPLVAKPGQEVVVAGTNLTNDIQLRIGDQSVALTNADGTSAKFIMPMTPRAGAFAVTVGRHDQSGGEVAAAAKFLLADSAGDAYPIYMAAAEDICAPTAFRDGAGELQVGLKDCSPIAVDLSNLTAANIKTGVTINGVTGTLIPSPSHCMNDGETGCVVAGSYAAAVTTGLSSKVMSGEVVAGISGSVTLPPDGKVYVGTSYGVGGTGSTGTLTLPAPGSVIATAPTYGDPSSPVTPQLPVCASDGGIGCVTTPGFKAADMSVATVGNIKKNVIIAGVVGDYPSVGNPLAGDTSVPDLTNTFFNSKITSNADFEYFDSAGNAYVHPGDGDVIPAKIASGVDIFGTVGMITSPPAWDLRVGTSVVAPSGTISGLLKTNCRSGAAVASLDMDDYPRPVTFDTGNNWVSLTAHGYANNTAVKLYAASMPTGFSDTATYYVLNATTNNFQLTATSGGSTAVPITSGAAIYMYKVGSGSLDVWDTIDDFNVSTSMMLTTPSSYSGWGDANLCGGLTSVASDSAVWMDVTTDVGGAASTCGVTATNCSIKDKITGQDWHKADGTTRNWSQALSFCDGLTYNNKSDWRLPTQKELLEAYNHGIMTTADAPNWMTQISLGASYWSSTTNASDSGNAWRLIFRSGNSITSTKTGVHSTICIRP